MPCVLAAKIFVLGAEKDGNVSVTSSAFANAVEAKLPNLELPYFSWDVNMWTSFGEQCMGIVNFLV